MIWEGFPSPNMINIVYVYIAINIRRTDFCIGIKAMHGDYFVWGQEPLWKASTKWSYHEYMYHCTPDELGVGESQEPWQQ